MYKRYIKRIIDIIGSIILIVLTAPLMLVMAIIIKRDGGPVLYKQKRTGKDGINFIFQKFRSSKIGNDDNPYLNEDDKYTKFGLFIRKTSIDELGQLFNILKGEMSFIGPRPWMTHYAEFFTKEQKRRLEVLPGITGLAQCQGRNDLSVKDKIKKDIEYVDNITFLNDIKIVLKTIKSVFVKEGYSNSKEGIKNELEELQMQKLD